LDICAHQKINDPEANEEKTQTGISYVRGLNGVFHHLTKAFPEFWMGFFV
jgi:hypothetical protein